jgi:hypothetical protein
LAFLNENFSPWVYTGEEPVFQALLDLIENDVGAIAAKARKGSK